MLKQKFGKKGFTLAELLIVIAIIAILVAIMIPVFSAQLNKARAAAELANVRAAYSEEVVNVMMSGTGSLIDAAGNVEINMANLGKACKQTETTIKVTTLPKPATDTAVEVKGVITVEYKGYTGTFDIDGDVSFLDNKTVWENGEAKTAG